MPYTVLNYCNMIADRVRAEAYDQALKRAVRPGSVVVDIGTGTGVFALLACRYGAARVYAIEPNPAIRVAEELARANGVADRIRFFRASSTEVELPERADVIVSDLRGSLPLLGGHLPAVVDARERFLAEDGVLIPREDRLFVAPAEAEAVYRRYVGRWEENHFGFDVTPLRRMLVNTEHDGRPKETSLLAEPSIWATLDYRELGRSDVVGHGSWQAARAGTVHGFHLHFETDLADGISFSTAPDRPELIYGSLFLPLEAPTPVEAGAAIEIRLQAALAGEVYLWHWTTSIDACRESGTHQVRQDQSSLLATPLALEDLRRRAEDAVPGLSEDGARDRHVLEGMARGLSVQQIARSLAESFPGHHESWEGAMAAVGRLVDRYGRPPGA